MNCRKCGMPVSREEYDEIGHRYPESILDLGYCLPCSTAVVSEIEEEAEQDRTMNNPPQDEGDQGTILGEILAEVPRSDDRT